MFRLFPLLVLITALASLCGCRQNSPMAPVPLLPYTGRDLELFVGSASQPPVEEACRAFEAHTGARCVTHFGGSGKMLSELVIARRGDVYFPGSSDYMARALREGVVRRGTVRQVVYLVPAINVPRGNPKSIGSLADLAHPDVKVGLARPDTVCVGLYAVEVLAHNGLAEQVQPNISTYAESCSKLAQLVSLSLVDAVLGWEVFETWDPEHIETILLQPEEVPRIGYIPIGLTTFTTEPELAEAFITFIIGPEGQAIFRRWGYLTSEPAARRLARPETPLGGEWPLPAGWP